MSSSSVDPWSPVRWAENGAVRLAFDQWSERVAGEPLLLTIGLGANRKWFPDGLCRMLAAHGFAVARYDQRDGGESTHLPPTATRNPISALFKKRGEAYTAEDMADDAVAVMDALDWPSAHLLGVSLGGAVAQRVALRHPDRVRTLTTMAAVPGDAAGLRALQYVRLRTLAKFAGLKFPDTSEGNIAAGATVTRLLASPKRPFDEPAAREAAARNLDSGVHDQQAQSRQIGAQWHGQKISAITRPTLVLHGEDDPLIKPRAGKAIASRVPGSRLVPLPEVGHEIPESAWKRVAAEVRALADTARHLPAGSTNQDGVLHGEIEESFIAAEGGGEAEEGQVVA
ncbi:alpha/beta hydrolase [Streptomyces chrestomyceticus]|uniref:Alpha/beta hydrolase n=1 Tax=Streptomyces chrestomyceticus TaxID=68185 RepID=A0ABU7WRB6_9ACTN